MKTFKIEGSRLSGLPDPNQTYLCQVTGPLVGPTLDCQCLPYDPNFSYNALDNYHRIRVRIPSHVVREAVRLSN